MKRIEFIAPVESMRGNLSGNQNLEYAENNNPAFDAPAGVQYARNYQPRFIGAKRSATGKTYFQVKTKSATLVSISSKQKMALLGGTGAVRAAILAYASVRGRLETIYAAAKDAGHTAAKTIEAYVYERVYAALLAKSVMITFNESSVTQSLVFQNPWVYTTQSGGLAITIKNVILVKFWMQLAPNPIVFTVDGLKGVAHGGEDADTFATVAARHYNVLGLSIASGSGSQPVMLGEDHVCFESGGVLYNAMSGKQVTRQADPATLTDKFVLSAVSGEPWDD